MHTIAGSVGTPLATSPGAPRRACTKKLGSQVSGSVSQAYLSDDPVAPAPGLLASHPALQAGMHPK